MSATVEGESCVQARLALSLAIDGEASGSELYLTAMHLGRCEPCRVFAARLRAITSALRSSGRAARRTTNESITRGARS